MRLSYCSMKFVGITGGNYVIVYHYDQDFQLRFFEPRDDIFSIHSFFLKKKKISMLQVAMVLVELNRPKRNELK